MAVDADKSSACAMPAPRRAARSDALRNLDALLDAAKTVFANAGVDAPVRDIAQEAGVGVATVYRHFPQRAQLIAAVFRREIDACVEAAPLLAEAHEPAEALKQWMRRYACFIATKRGLATALHSGDPAYDGLPEYFETRLTPALDMLLDTAAREGQIRRDIKADELLNAAACLGMQAPGDKPGATERMVSLLVDGLRFGA
jgi:AcrR family transcriptional regulator